MFIACLMDIGLFCPKFVAGASGSAEAEAERDAWSFSASACHGNGQKQYKIVMSCNLLIWT